MPTPPLRSNFVDVRTPEPHELPADEYNLNAQRTDTALDTAVSAITAAAVAQSTADSALDGLADAGETLNADGYITFTDKPNGDPPAQLDTGQPVDYTLQLVSNRKPQVSGGRLVSGASGGGAYADYYQAQFPRDLRSAGTRFTINTADGSTQGVVCLAIWDGIIEGAGTLIPKSPAHITLDTLTGQVVWWVTDGTDNTHLKGIKSWNITPPASDGTAVWELGFKIDTRTGEGWLWLPGPVSSGADLGKRRVKITDAEITTFFATYFPAFPALPSAALAYLTAGADVAMIEHQCNATANTARFARYIDMWAEESRPARQMLDSLTQPAEVEVAVHEAASKVIPVDNDEFLLVDSEAAYSRKRLTWANLRALVISVISAATMTLSNKTLTTPRVGTLLDTNGNAAANFSATASAVNYVQFLNSAAGFPLGVRAAGTDANIALNIRGKGTSGVTIGSGNEPVMTTTSHLIDEDNFATNTDTKAPTQQSTKAYIAAQIAALIGAAPAELDTWIELVAAIQNDQSAIAAINTALSGKQPLAADLTNLVALLAGISAGSSTQMLAYTWATDTWSALQSSSFGRSWLALSDAAAARSNLGIAYPYDMHIPVFTKNSVRAAGTGEFPQGIKLRRAITVNSISVRGDTAGASGNLVVELQKNGVTIAASATAVTLTNAQQSAAGGGNTVTGLAVAFAAGDVITATITTLDTAPGKGLFVDIGAVA